MDGVQSRQIHRFGRRIYHSKGPNFVWHVDGCDKLKPFGFDIHGAIDGFSRKILWLRVLSSNKNPRQVADLYIKCCEKYQMCPAQLRSDRGTENTVLATLQMMQRHDGRDEFAGPRSYHYGRSVFNQRIEAFWSLLKRCFTQWWLLRFKGMQNSGTIDFSNKIERDSMRLILMKALQKDLDSFLLRWNNHIIRRQRGRTIQRHSCPNDLFYLPQEYGAEDCKKTIVRDVIAYGKIMTNNASEIHNIPEELVTVCAAYLRHCHWTVDALSELEPNEA